jgi:hypothetical protein
LGKKVGGQRDRVSDFNIEEVANMRKEMIKPFVWGIVVGAIVLLIVIFSAGWVVTSGSAQDKAEEMAEKAVIDQLTPICVEQFLKDPNREELLKELKEKSSWERAEYVEKSGWATMPGAESPVRGVADECARRLMDLKR